jgi:hypothetical protein
VTVGGVFCGCVFRAAAAACVAWWPGVPVAVAEAEVVRLAVVSFPGDEADRPEFAAAATMMTRAPKARSAVSALWRAGQDLPRGGGGPEGGGGGGGPEPCRPG